MALVIQREPRRGHLQTSGVEEQGRPLLEHVPLLVEPVNRPVLFEAVVGIVFDVEMTGLRVDVEDGLVAALPWTRQRVASVHPFGVDHQIVARQLQQAPRAGAVGHPHQRWGYPGVHGDL